MIKIAIFASGSGTNAENIIKYFKKSRKIRVVCVCCNNPDAYVIKRADDLNVDVLIAGKKSLNETRIVDNYLFEKDVDYIVLAGFLLLLPTRFMQYYENRIVNIHPALLPKYGGKGMYGHHVHEAVIANHEKQSGITIHKVNEHYDQGEIIFQATCDIAPTDTPDDLAAKIHELEQANFPQVIEKDILSLKSKNEI